MNVRTAFLPAVLLLTTAGARAEVQTLPVRLSIGEYQVERVGGLDLVTIPDGQTLSAADGRPEVPYHVVQLVYPPEYRIQEVLLKEKAGLKPDSGLLLPIAQPTQGPEVTAIAGAFPAADFAWSVAYKDSTRVALSVYPFRHDPKTRKSTFHSDFEFEVRYVRSLVRIAEVLTDTAAYDPGSPVRLSARLENSGAAQEVRVAASVHRPQSGEVVAELPAITIERLGRADSTLLQWPTAGQVPGSYAATVMVRDAAGAELDRRRVSFRLGNPQAEVTDFTAEPLPFKLGSRVRFKLTIKNTGNCDLAGEGVIRITRAGEIVDELRQKMTTLRPGSTTVLRDSWNTAAAEKGAVYTAAGFAVYAGTAGEVKSLVLSTNAMPVPMFTPTPDTAKVGDETAFDASASSDRDGTIAAYRWDFGDGGVAEGRSVLHTYHQPGDYPVRLTVTDSEGGQAELTRVVTVVD